MQIEQDKKKQLKELFEITQPLWVTFVFCPVDFFLLKKGGIFWPVYDHSHVPSLMFSTEVQESTPISHGPCWECLGPSQMASVHKEILGTLTSNSMRHVYINFC